MSRSVPPTVQVVASFIESLFPKRARDVPLIYHVPRACWFDLATTPATSLILSITPTEGVYDALNVRQKIPPVAFLHRPFDLDRRRVRRGSTVLSCHVGFDEVLTVGWNVELARRLGVDEASSVTLQGYKGDPERRIGIVGQVSWQEGELLRMIEHEFTGIEGSFGLDDGTKVTTLAIMNAFHPEEVDRVHHAAVERGWLADQGHEDKATVLYLTGQVRDKGLEAAMAKGWKVVCVGHRKAEEWGIRHLARQVRAKFPGLQVTEICEDEAARSPKVSPQASDMTGQAEIPCEARLNE